MSKLRLGLYGLADTTLAASIAAPLRSLAPTVDTIDAFVKSKSASIKGSLIQVQAW
jgi:hypothetical protein